MIGTCCLRLRRATAAHAPGSTRAESSARGSSGRRRGLGRDDREGAPGDTARLGGAGSRSTSDAPGRRADRASDCRSGRSAGGRRCAVGRAGLDGAAWRSRRTDRSTVPAGDTGPVCARSTCGAGDGRRPRADAARTVSEPSARERRRRVARTTGAGRGSAVAGAGSAAGDLGAGAAEVASAGGSF